MISVVNEILVCFFVFYWFSYIKKPIPRKVNTHRVLAIFLCFFHSRPEVEPTSKMQIVVKVSSLFFFIELCEFCVCAVVCLYVIPCLFCRFIHHPLSRFHVAIANGIHILCIGFTINRILSILFAFVICLFIQFVIWLEISIGCNDLIVKWLESILDL